MCFHIDQIYLQWWQIPLALLENLLAPTIVPLVCQA
jgi:hypothetical protein